MIKTIFGSTIELRPFSNSSKDGEEEFWLIPEKTKFSTIDSTFIQSDFYSLMNVDLLHFFYKELIDGKTKFFTIKIQQNQGFDTLWNFSTEIISTHLSIVPGSFNPLTQAHLCLMQCVIMENPANDLLVELSLNRRGKEVISFEELYDRLKQFIQCNIRDISNTKEIKIIVTNSEFFYQKVEAINSSIGGIKNQTYHIGADTFLRLYEDHGISFINNLECKFVVYDRIMNDNDIHLSFSNMRDKALYTNVIKAKFQLPENLLTVSSSAIRKEMEDGVKATSNV